MLADTFTLDFRNLLLISALVVFAMVLGYRLLNRDERIKRTRWGFFVERNRFEDEEPDGILYHMPPIPPPTPPPPIPLTKERPMSTTEESEPTPDPEPEGDDDGDETDVWPHRDDAR